MDIFTEKNFHYCRQRIQHYFFVFLMLFHFYLLGNQNVRETIDAIPKSEKEDLERLFHNLFNRGNFCYTLFGDKPMSLATYSTTLFDGENMPSTSGLEFWRRWRVWKKHADAFPTTSYLLLEDPLDKDGS